MIGVILAAGRGMRLREAYASPKCLVEIGGLSLLERQLRALGEFGARARVVVGFEAAMVQDHVCGLSLDLPVELVENPDFEEGSVISAMLGLHGAGESVVLMDGDVLFHPDVFRHLMNSACENALAIDTSVDFTDEEYMAGVVGDQVVQLRRGPANKGEIQGEWVGIAKIGQDSARRMSSLLQGVISAGGRMRGYEDVLASLIDEVPVSSVDVAGLPWIEIDFPEDLDAAFAMAEGSRIPMSGHARRRDEAG
jgi:choline kinase